MAHDGDRPKEQGPLDGLYRDQKVLGIILSVCCFGIGLILSIVGLVTAKDPEAKKNAQLCLIISIVVLLLSCGGYGILAVIGALAGGR